MIGYDLGKVWYLCIDRMFEVTQGMELTVVN